MQSDYDILLMDKPVGTVAVHKEGLYYRFLCTCKLPDPGFHRLVVRCGDKEEPLGLLVPKGDSFCLEKRISIKKLGEGRLEFRIINGSLSDQERFIPVYPHEPFAYLSSLKDAYLSRKGEQAGVVIRDRSEDQQDNGQSQRFPDRSEQ